MNHNIEIMKNKESSFTQIQTRGAYITKIQFIKKLMFINVFEFTFVANFFLHNKGICSLQNFIWVLNRNNFIETDMKQITI